MVAQAAPDTLPVPAVPGRRIARPPLVIGGVLFVAVAVVAALGLLALVNSGLLTSRHTVAGTFDLTGSFDGSTCQGSDGYDDIREGLGVTLTDGDGKVLATSSLGPGTPNGLGDCEFTFSLGGVPEVASYSVEVGDRGRLTYLLEDMRSAGWTFGLTLGD
jgi:hypothetical protein